MDSENTDDAPRSWGQRNGLTIIVAVMGLLFALVIIVQALT